MTWCPKCGEGCDCDTDRRKVDAPRMMKCPICGKEKKELTYYALDGQFICKKCLEKYTRQNVKDAIDKTISENTEAWKKLAEE